MKKASEWVLFHFQAFVVRQEWRGKKKEKGMKRVRDGGAEAVSFCASASLLPMANWLWRIESVCGEQEEREAKGGRFF